MPDRDELAERIALVLKDHSQAEIARRTGTTTPSVSRYLNGTRVPADFCGALVREFGVNPQWLLTGQGVPFAADIAPNHEQFAGSLLELVEAMNAVARIRLGAIAGKKPGRVLRELSDALERYESVHKRLLEYSTPVLKKLITTLAAALRKQPLPLPEVRALLESADQIAQFCEDPTVRMILDSLRAEYAWRAGRRDEALRMQEDVVHRWLLSSHKHHEVAYIQVLNFATALKDRRRLIEARRVVRAALALGEEVGPRWRAIALLRCQLGNMEIELGRLQDGLLLLNFGLSCLRNCEPAAQPSDIASHSAQLERAQLLSGALSLPDMLKRDVPQLAATVIARFALWVEDAELLAQACAKLSFKQPEVDLHAALVSAATPLLAEALQGKANAGRKFQAVAAELTGTEPAPTLRCQALVLQCQMVRVAGGKSAAAKLAAEADALQREFEAVHTMPIELRAIHARNMVEAGNKSAQRWFTDLAASGYHCFDSRA
jgi:hypothetical protein